MEQSRDTDTLREPIELDDLECAAVAGGFFNFTNSSNSGNVRNSFNNAFNNSPERRMAER